MKILAIETELSTASSDYAPHLRAEAAQIWELQNAGIIREIYFTVETNEAVIVLECDSVEKAWEHINSLPLVQNGLITFNVCALKPYSGYARLFD